MNAFKELSEAFTERFNKNLFIGKPATLYEPCGYFLSIGGKRIRPALCLMANSLYGNISDDAWHVAAAIELFHNFTLIHDDIMDGASLRRGMQTVHTKYNSNIGILSGDVMMIQSIDELNKISSMYLQKILGLFNKTAREVCEGQQLDMDFETKDHVTLEEYLEMITLKTSVLLACSLQMGAILANAPESDCQNLYEFGKNLGIAFQIQDDYLDAFGDPQKFGKEVGGDIKHNKKTFLMLYALDVATPEQKEKIYALLQSNSEDKVPKMLELYKDCNAHTWANTLKHKYLQIALQHLAAIQLPEANKNNLLDLAEYLIKRDV